MDEFYRDALRFGCLQGFKHFSLYLRGREELLVTVFHGDAADIGSSGGGAGGEAGARSMGTICESAAAAGSLPKSMKTSGVSTSPRARSTKPAGSQSNTFIPASPASHGDGHESPGQTVFLIGAYAKYVLPYVWLRSKNVSRGGGGGGEGWRGAAVAGAGGSSPGGISRENGGGDRDRDGDGDDDDDARDLPLDLNTTQRWELGKHRVWDIVEELVNMNVFPNPVNPFAVDHAALRRQPPEERFLTTGAMVSFLRDILVADTGDGANQRIGLSGGSSGRGGGRGGDQKVGGRVVKLSLDGVSEGLFTAAVEGDMNTLVTAHLAAVCRNLVARAAN